MPYPASLFLILPHVFCFATAPNIASVLVIYISPLSKELFGTIDQQDHHNSQSYPAQPLPRVTHSPCLSLVRTYALGLDATPP